MRYSPAIGTTPASGKPSRASDHGALSRALRTLQVLVDEELAGDVPPPPAEAVAPSDTDADAPPRPVAASAPQRRRFPRRGGVAQVAICLLQDDRPVTEQRLTWLLHGCRQFGEVVDISLNGIAFDFAPTLELGQRLCMKLQNRRHDAQLVVTGRIVRVLDVEVAAAAAPRRRIFCHFERALALPDLQHFAHLMTNSFI